MKCPDKWRIESLVRPAAMTVRELFNAHLDKIFEGAEVVYGNPAGAAWFIHQDRHVRETHTAILLPPQVLETECGHKKISSYSNGNHYCVDCNKTVKPAGGWVPVDEPKGGGE